MALHSQLPQALIDLLQSRDLTMPQTLHVIKHLTSPWYVRDIAIGMSDGPILRPPTGSSGAARPFRGAWQTVIVGGLAAAAAFVIAKAIG